MNKIKEITNLTHKDYWGEDGGYYRKTPSDLKSNPLPLPRPDIPFFRKLEKRLFEYLPKKSKTSLLEIGCGSSALLPYFHLNWGYEVSGIDYNPYAAKLAEANLEGHGIKANIYCRDIFDASGNKNLEASFNIVYSHGVVEHFDDAVETLKTFGRYLKEGGYIVTLVPNLQGINYLAQKWVDARILGMHILHNRKSLRVSHESAGYDTLLCEYIGVYDGWLTEGGSCQVHWRRKMHWIYCYTTNVFVNKVLKYTGYKIMPEFSCISPYILYMGKKQTRLRDRS